jgi:hypothetical protein
MITLVMGFLPMDQMMLKSERIIRLDGDFIFRSAAAEIVVNMGGMMIDDHNHPSDPMCFRGFPKDARFFEKPTQVGNLFDFEIMSAGTFEELPLGAYYERKLVVSVRLDLANLSDEVNYSAPT